MVIAQTKTLYIIGVFDTKKDMKYYIKAKNTNEKRKQNQGNCASAVESCANYLVAANC